ncbi:MAG: lipocalin family protein [Betaproteobacteria bacterium]
MKSALLGALLALAGCASRPPMPTVSHVDLQRFMGDWRVIASIPTWIEKDAYDAVESYRLDDDGTIATTFTFVDGGFGGTPKRYTPRGFVLDRTSNARWGMQFVWPIKADYRIIHLDDGYTQTVIGRAARDYVWIMARTPQISDADYARLVDVVRQAGYDTGKLRKVPQRTPAGARAAQ